MQMRKSRVLELLRAGKPVFSIKLNTTDPRISELAALTGFTCIWVDMEHTPNDYSVVLGGRPSGAGRLFWRHHQPDWQLLAQG